MKAKKKRDEKWLQDSEKRRKKNEKRQIRRNIDNYNKTNPAESRIAVADSQVTAEVEKLNADTKEILRGFWLTKTPKLDADMCAPYHGSSKVIIIPDGDRVYVSFRKPVEEFQREVVKFVLERKGQLRWVTLEQALINAGDYPEQSKLFFTATELEQLKKYNGTSEIISRIKSEKEKKGKT